LQLGLIPSLYLAFLLADFLQVIVDESFTARYQRRGNGI
jgi:hypothetical protein